MGTVFVAGSYGVGKSTLCDQLSHRLGMPCFSAGDLISRVNGETYGATKAVSDKSANQDILAMEVQKILSSSTNILLAGHFCIFDKLNHVEPLPDTIYSNLGIDCILLLEADPEQIISNLGKRDKKTYSEEEITKLIVAENNYAHKIANDHQYFFHSLSSDLCEKAVRRFSHTASGVHSSENWSLSTMHRGHWKSSGMSSHLVPGAIPPSG